MAILRPEVVIRYSKRGEDAWCSTISRDSSDGPAAAKDLLKKFCIGVGRTSPDESCLIVVPARPGGQPVEVAPVLGQSLAAFLEHTCRHDDGGYQLRGVFNVPSDSAFLLISVAFPGTVPQSAGSAESDVRRTMIVEHFECEAAGTVATLKEMVQRRTGFPIEKLILLQDGVRLQSTSSLSHVHAALGNKPLLAHVAADGVYAFLRKDGMGHHDPVGPHRLRLQLPQAWRGARTLQVSFDLDQRLADFKLSVQSVTGLPPATLQFTLSTPEKIEELLEVGDEQRTLASLGVEDGCTLKINSSAENSVSSTCQPISLDVPTQGNAMHLYEQVAQRLNIPSADRICLFSGDLPIGRSTDLSSAPLADGCLLGVYMRREIQIRFSILSRCSAASSSIIATGSSASFPEDMVVKCYSSDTIEEVRERTCHVLAARNSEHLMQVRGSKVFIFEKSVWDESGETCRSMAALEELLGNFVPCSEHDRLSCLGVTDSDSHLLFVPEQHFSLEVLVHVDGECVGTRKLRALGTLHLEEVGKILKKELQEKPLDMTIDPQCQIDWILGNDGYEIACNKLSEVSMLVTSPTRGVGALVGSAAAAMTSGKRRSLGGTPSDSKRRRSTSSQPDKRQLSEDDFVGDIFATHCTSDRDLPAHFLCPISLEVMRDPVLVCGSGNTYDRQSIERHFQRRFTDPITNMELRKASERKLVSNNTLRSQIDEAEQSRIDLRLIALLSDKPRKSSKGDATMGAWFTSWLSKS